MILNDPDTINKQLLVKTINNQSVEINDLKLQLQDKLHVINQLKHLLAQKSQKTHCELPIVDSRIQKIEDENVSLAFQEPNFIHLLRFLNQRLFLKLLRKNDLSKSVTSHLTTNKIIEKCTKFLALGLLKIDIEPINEYFKNNRVVHRDYLRVTKEHAATLQELLEQARALKPLDEHIGYASKFVAPIQELVSSTNASGSKPRSNTKNDRILQPSSRSMKNKVEAHHGKFKSSANKNNHVSDCNVNVKNVALSKNSDTICLSCNEYLFSANHDACVAQYLKKMQKRKVAKSAKQKVTSEWKPTRRIFKTVGLKWVPTGRMFTLIVKIVLWYSDSGCSNHMTRHRDKLINFVSKFIRTVRFGNDHFVAIMGYGDLQMGNILISRVYYVEGLGHNLFPVGQFCDSDLEVAFRKHTCFVRNLEGVDLLSGSRGFNLYTISMTDMKKSSPICLLSKALKTKFWLWHRRLSHLNFGTINKLAKQVLVESINKKRYILVIVDDYSRFTWLKFLRTKDKASEIIIKYLKQAQVNLNATTRYLRTNNGTEFLNQTLRKYTKDIRITHMTSTARTPKQNGVAERRNRMLVKAARTMLIFSKSPLFLWAEAVATVCYTQNQSLIHTRYDKTPYELLIDHKLELKYLHVFGALCYLTNDFKDLGKLRSKANIGIFIGYSSSKKVYQIYNKRTRQLMETMNLKFDELTHMASEQHSSGPDLQGLTSGHNSSGLVLNHNPSVASNPIFAATLPPPDTAEVSSSSSTFVDKDAPSLSISPNNETSSPPINSTNVEPNEEVVEFNRDTFTNLFAPPKTSSAESSLQIVDT
ncbi:retrovirus-related pol polyprotein from transposon TNT 1-94 [Tanacetum coccineum]